MHRCTNIFHLSIRWPYCQFFPYHRHEILEAAHIGFDFVDGNRNPINIPFLAIYSYFCPVRELCELLKSMGPIYLIRVIAVGYCQVIIVAIYFVFLGIIVLPALGAISLERISMFDDWRAWLSGGPRDNLHFIQMENDLILLKDMSWRSIMTQTAQYFLASYTCEIL
jgi:hypothetical protein